MTVDFMSASIMERVLHPPYLPNRAPCDFYLFDYIKESVTRKEFIDREDLLEAINHILEGIDEMTLKQVFLRWMEHHI
jgi:hypothetical protein